MKSITYFSAAALLASVATFEAHAQDPGAFFDPWSGAYVGIGAGYGFGDSNLGFVNSPAQTVTIPGGQLCQLTTFSGDVLSGPIYDPDALPSRTVVGNALGTPIETTIFETDPFLAAVGLTRSDLVPSPVFGGINGFDVIAIADGNGGVDEGGGVCTPLATVNQLAVGGVTTFSGRTNAGVVVDGPTTTTQGFIGPLGAATNVDAATINAVSALPGTSRDLDISGHAIDLFTGYGMTNGRFYYGAELGLGVASIDDSTQIGQFRIHSELDRMVTARVRFGMPMGDWLPYVTGGVAVAHSELNYSLNGVSVSDDNRHVGGTIGAGIEWAATSNLSARFEYSFTRFEDERYFSQFGYDVNKEIDVSKVMVSLVWRPKN